MVGAQAQVLDTNKNHNWPRFVGNTVASMGVAFVGKTALKAVVNEERPDHSDNKSFPSGHAAVAFAAARSIDKELFLGTGPKVAVTTTGQTVDVVYNF